MVRKPTCNKWRFDFQGINPAFQTTVYKYHSDGSVTPFLGGICSRETSHLHKKITTNPQVEKTQKKKHASCLSSKLLAKKLISFPSTNKKNVEKTVLYVTWNLHCVAFLFSNFSPENSEISISLMDSLSQWADDRVGDRVVEASRSIGAPGTPKTNGENRTY